MSAMPAARFSPDRRYRYLLTRRLGPGEAAVNFVMLNPSTADEERDDPTIRRCIGFARKWGFNLLLVTNLSPLRATDARDLMRSGPEPESVARRNLSEVFDAAARSRLVVLAYGNNGEWEGRAQRTLALLAERSIETHALGVTALGHPRHPLYARGDSRPVPFGAGADTSGASPEESGRA